MENKHFTKISIYLPHLLHLIPPFSLHLQPQTKASRVFPPVHNTEINPKRESVEQKGASVWTVVIVGLVISWLWGHNTVVHTVVVDSHTSFPALLSVSMEKLLCCSRCGQAASPLPRLLYVPQNRGKSRIKALLSPRLWPYWGGVAGCFHRDISCNLGFGLHHAPPPLQKHHSEVQFRTLEDLHLCQADSRRVSHRATISLILHHIQLSFFFHHSVSAPNCPCEWIFKLCTIKVAMTMAAACGLVRCHAVFFFPLQEKARLLCDKYWGNAANYLRI